jgi:hypothetical protein
MRKPATLLILVLFLSYGLKAQDGEMQTLTNGLRHSGGYGALLFKSSSFIDEPLILLGGRGVWVINRAFGIGFEGNGIVPVNTYEGMDPLGLSKAFLVGGYGGLLLEPVIFSNKLVHVTFPVSGGAGWLGYVRDWQEVNYDPSPGDLYDDDIFWYLEPGAAIEVNVARFFRVDLGFTKRFTQDIDLVNTGNGEFEKVNFLLALKFGRF